MCINFFLSLDKIPKDRDSVKGDPPQIKFMTRKPADFKSLGLSWKEITQVIWNCQMSVSLIKILICCLVQSDLLEILIYYIIIYTYIIYTINLLVLKTYKPPPPMYVVKLLHCSEQLFWRTNGDSCFTIVSFIKCG